MTKCVSMTAAALIAALAVAPAMAKHRVGKPRAAHGGTTTGSTAPRGNNAEFGGNNGNSASGSNSLTNPNNPGSTGSGM
jgi:hypothetical protein